MKRTKKLGIEVLESRQLLAADPILSEFMASNSTTLDDGNGASSDWIEIYNNGDQSVELAGYGLTDDAADANKWLFPSVTLPAGEFLVVYASGNNTPDSAGNLHTNFSLAASGEYVGLVDPGGTVLSEFGPGGSDFPQQTSDIAYGLAFDSEGNARVTPNSAARYFIPTNSSVDSTWTLPSFNDASWQSGTASLGYENSPADYAGLIQTTLPTGTTSAYVRIPFTATDADAFLDTLQMKYDDGFIAYVNGTRVASANAPATGAYNSLATTDHPDGLAVNYVDFDVSAYSQALNVGVNTLSIHMLNRSSSSDLLSVPNLILASGGLLDPPVVGPLITPTPGLG